MAGWLASAESAIRYDGGAAPLWVTLMLAPLAGLLACASVSVRGARRSVVFVGALLGLTMAGCVVTSLHFGLHVPFLPIFLSLLASFAVTQALRLWRIDAALARGVQAVATRATALAGGETESRLANGLKLLETVLPLEEAVVFRLDERGRPAQAARLRRSPAPGAAGSDTDARRVRAWREGVRTCEGVIKSGETVVRSDGEGDECITTVALPLAHEGRAVGALLVRLRGSFDEEDRPLLENVCAQFTRNLQREDARSLGVPSPRETFFSARAAAQRLEAFRAVSGLLTEEGFAAHALSEVPYGHAVAYVDGTMAFVNDEMLSAARLDGAARRQLDLFSLLDCFRTGVFDEPSIAVRRVLQTGSPYERELSFPERGEVLSLRIALICSNSRGGRGAESVARREPLCFAVTVRDVTHVKENEKLRSDMVSLMSHELRTPVTSIGGFADLLAADESLPAEAREFAGIINSEAQRLTRMINAFLAVTRLEQSDKQEVRKVPLMLDDVVRETISNYQAAAKRKRIRLVENGGGKLPPVAADRSLITRALSNLVENAIKYSPERTAVTLSTALEADTVRVVVEDRGYGVPPEAIDRVWEKFYRVARDGQDKEEESTGLGLSFVREVVEQHGGQVALESEAGRGSRFSFTLPRL